MPTPPVRKFTTWSFSRYRDHLQCPRRAKLTHIEKLDRSALKSPALIRGETVHRSAEQFIRGEVRTLASELRTFKDEFRDLRKRRASAEGKFAVDRTWKLVDFFDWDRAWGRMVADAHYVDRRTAFVIDFKTGKMYPDNEEQLELYAIPVLLTYPDAAEVRTALWYVDQGKIGGERTFTRKKLPVLIKTWTRRVVSMLTDTKFVPRPGEHCRYCNFRKTKGGPCEY
jgi:CRISPR/Cas system-associated exonuclease Cas4 (RecB family)